MCLELLCVCFFARFQVKPLKITDNLSKTESGICCHWGKMFCGIGYIISLFMITSADRKLHVDVSRSKCFKKGFYGFHHINDFDTGYLTNSLNWKLKKSPLLYWPFLRRLCGGLVTDSRRLLLLWWYVEDLQRNEDRLYQFLSKVFIFRFYPYDIRICPHCIKAGNKSLHRGLIWSPFYFLPLWALKILQGRGWGKSEGEVGSLGLGFILPIPASRPLSSLQTRPCWCKEGGESGEGYLVKVPFLLSLPIPRHKTWTGHAIPLPTAPFLPSLPQHRITDTCENITFPRTTYVVGN